jgi:hypothetical protein
MLNPAFRRSLVAAYGGFSQQESLGIKHKGLTKADERIQKLFSATSACFPLYFHQECCDASMENTKKKQGTESILVN